MIFGGILSNLLDCSANSETYAIPKAIAAKMTATLPPTFAKVLQSVTKL